mgnify:CR=1 FL=1
MHKAVERPPAVNLLPAINHVPLLRPLRWLRQAMRDLFKAPVACLFYGQVFALLELWLHWLFVHAPHQIITLATGLMLLGPFLATGLYDIGRRLELGEKRVLLPSLTAWKANLSGIGLFAMILALTFAGWMRVSVVLFALFYTDQVPTLDDMFSTTFFTTGNIAFLLAYFSCGALFALLVFAISVISMPMLLDRNSDTLTAIFASVQAMLRNPLAMCVWGLCIALLSFAGIALYYAGLIISMPLLGLASWHAYRDIVAAPAD